MNIPITSKVLIPVIAGLLMAALSCNKDGNGTTTKENRIAAIKTSVSNHIYHYDAQNQLAGIDYGVSSRMKATYSPSGIILQWYDGTDNPTDHRMEINVVDDRVISVKETNTNYKTDHYYAYDDEGKMTQAQATKTKLPDNQIENNGIASFTWSGDRLTRVLLEVRDRYGVKSDSIIWDMTYYGDKKFITWADVGFSVFGKTPIGGFPNGFGWRTPINFLSADIIPSNAAMKSISRKSYYNHNGQWQPSSGGTQYPETDYRYDTQGRLMGWQNGVEITWK